MGLIKEKLTDHPIVSSNLIAFLFRFGSGASIQWIETQYNIENNIDNSVKIMSYIIYVIIIAVGCIGGLKNRRKHIVSKSNTWEKMVAVYCIIGIPACLLAIIRAAIALVSCLCQ